MTITHIQNFLMHANLVEKILLGWAAFVSLLLIWYIFSKVQLRAEQRKTRTTVYHAIRSGAKMPPQVLQAYPEYMGLYRQIQTAKR